MIENEGPDEPDLGVDREPGDRDVGARDVDARDVDARDIGAAGRWTQDLREAAADRVPTAVRAVGPANGYRAALAALLVAVAVGAAMLARSGSGPEPSSTVPVRPAASRPAWSASARSGIGEPIAAAAGQAPSVAHGPGPTVPVVAGGPVVVDVVGQVQRPGLVRLPAGSRVWDAVLAAGGAARGARLDRINLARPLSDGEQVRVPSATDPVQVVDGAAALGAGPPAGPAGPAGGASSGGRPGASPIDLNTGAAGDFDGLPGVGPVLAGRIVAWRTQHGRFTRVDELGEVQGIGAKLLAALRPLVRV